MPSRNVWLKYGKVASLFLASSTAVLSQSCDLKEQDGSFTRLGLWLLGFTAVMGVLAVILHVLEVQSDADRQKKELIEGLEEERKLFRELRALGNPIGEIRLMMSL